MFLEIDGGLFGQFMLQKYLEFVDQDLIICLTERAWFYLMTRKPLNWDVKKLYPLLCGVFNFVTEMCASYILQSYFPRFRPENLEHNKILYEQVSATATRKGCTPSQLALAWVHHQGDDVCSIPGTTKIENLNQNIGGFL